MIDITTYRTNLNSNLQQFVQFFSTVDAEAMQFKIDNEWNLLEILEHVLLTEKTVLKTLAEGSESFSNYIEVLGYDKLRRVMIDYRHKKVKAPPHVEPGTLALSAQNLLLELQNGRNILIEDLQSARLIMGAEVHMHPMLGEMTVVDWLNFLLLHSERHLLQLQDQLQRYKDSKAGL